jgi:protein phosphatase
MHIACHGMTDVGRKRERNEDQFLIADMGHSILVEQTSLSYEDRSRFVGGTSGKLLVVADGMGGQAAGTRASTLAMDTILLYMLNLRPWLHRIAADQHEYLVDDLKAMLKRCDERIGAEGEANPVRKGMGTTITMAFVYGPKAHVVHAGDSRCYLHREDRLEQITRDDTLAQKLVDAGAIPPEKAAENRWSNVVTNVAGGEGGINPSVHTLDVKGGDTLLLCTDGLVRHVSDAEILRVLSVRGSVRGTAEALLALANDRGGTDNITVVVAKIREGHLDPSKQEERAKALNASQTVGNAPSEPAVMEREAYEPNRARSGKTARDFREFEHTASR